MSRRESWLLLTPGLALLVLAFFFPVAHLLVRSVVAGDLGGEWTLTGEHYARFFVDGYYLSVVERTLRLSLIITVACVLFGFPIAYLMVHGGPRLRFWLIVVTILPLMTSVVVRTFGWLVILGRGGLLATVLDGLGLAGRSFTLMHTETGIVLAMVQVLLPFMALTVAGVMHGIDPRLGEAARTMGCGFFGVLRHVVVPLSIPGIVSGSLLVFALSISSFITPGLVGGVRLPVLASSIYQQVLGTLDWPFAAAQSVLLLLAAFAVIAPYAALVRRRDLAA